jgi:creatinine amidohydrolase
VLPFSPTDGFVKPQWPGTISVSTELYTKINEAIVANMVVAGFKNIVLMGDHGGGQKQLEELAGSLDAKYSPQGVHVLYSAAAYFKARDDFNAILKEKNLPVSNHAGIPDTSELMYLGGDNYVGKTRSSSAISERVRAGLDRARLQGTKSGKPIGRPESSFRVMRCLDFASKVCLGARSQRRPGLA